MASLRKIYGNRANHSINRKLLYRLEVWLRQRAIVLFNQVSCPVMAPEIDFIYNNLLYGS